LYDEVGPEIAPETERLQREIWQRATAAATSDGAKADAAKLLLPAINDMIDITVHAAERFQHAPA
jgi:hypothetical protein